MNTDPQNSIPGARELSQAYEAAEFDEHPPENVDRLILSAARHRPKRRFTVLIPSLALAATVVLSFSLVLRTGLLNMGGEPPPTAGGLSTTTEVADDADLASDALAPAAEFAESLLEESLPPPAPLRQERAVPAIDGAEPEAAARRIQAGASSASPAPPADAVAESLQELDALVPQPAAVSLSSRVAPEAAEDCGSRNAEAPGDWVACITGQLERGAEDLARAGLDAFVAAYPDYPLPEPLQALRTPD